MQITDKDGKLVEYKFQEKGKDKKTERGELLRFFVDNIKNKNGKSYKFPFIAMKLSHLSINDLYYFVSACKDRLNREGQVTMQKYFWWSIKNPVNNKLDL